MVFVQAYDKELKQTIYEGDMPALPVEGQYIFFDAPDEETPEKTYRIKEVAWEAHHDEVAKNIVWTVVLDVEG